MRAKDIRAADGETRKLTSNWTAEAEKRGASVSSSSWATTAGTLSGAALSSNVATVLLAEAGDCVVTNTVTLANSEVLVREFSVFVE